MDRSKFRGGSIKSIKETRKDAEARSGYSSSANYLSVEEGTNVFRVMPPHPGNERAYVPFRRTFLKCNSEKWENGEPTGEFEVKNKSIFISTIHGGTEEDIIEIYCNFVYQLAKERTEHLKGDEKKKKEAEILFPIRGGNVGKKYQSGIQPSTSYMCYALKDGNLGRLELYSSWMKKIEELNIDEDGDEEAAVDRFSDPETGVHLIITKSKKEKNQSGYDYVIKKRDFNPSKHKDWNAFIEAERVTDKQLEDLLAMKDLEELYGSNVYKRSDFLYAVDGLQRLDEEHHYDIFSNESFLSKLEAMSQLFPETTENTENTETKSESKTSSPKEKEETMSPEGIDFTALSIPKLRKYIQDYIDLNYPGEQLPALPKPKLIEWAIITENDEDLPFDSSPEGSDPKATPGVEEKKPDTTSNPVQSPTKTETSKTGQITKSSASRIDRLRGLAGKK